MLLTGASRVKWSCHGAHSGTYPRAEMMRGAGDQMAGAVRWLIGLRLAGGRSQLAGLLVAAGLRPDDPRRRKAAGHAVDA